MVRYSSLLLLTLLVGSLPAPASAQINPFRSSRGAPLNAEDLAALTTATNRLLDRPTLTAGETEPWSNPKSDTGGTVTAGNSLHRKGMACRVVAYELTAASSSARRHATLTWCKTKDGWKTL
jgi:surface antigen